MIQRRICEMKVSLPLTDGPPSERLRLQFERAAAEKMRGDVLRLGLEPLPETFAVEWRGLIGIARMAGLVEVADERSEA